MFYFTKLSVTAFGNGSVRRLIRLLLKHYFPCSYNLSNRQLYFDFFREKFEIGDFSVRQHAQQRHIQSIF